MAIPCRTTASSCMPCAYKHEVDTGRRVGFWSVSRPCHPGVFDLVRSLLELRARKGVKGARAKVLGGHRDGVLAEVRHYSARTLSLALPLS